MIIPKIVILLIVEIRNLYQIIAKVCQLDLRGIFVTQYTFYALFFGLNILAGVLPPI